MQLRQTFSLYFQFFQALEETCLSFCGSRCVFLVATGDKQYNIWLSSQCHRTLNWIFRPSFYSSLNAGSDMKNWHYFMCWLNFIQVKTSCKICEIYWSLLIQSSSYYTWSTFRPAQHGVSCTKFHLGETVANLRTPPWYLFINATFATVGKKINTEHLHAKGKIFNLQTH